MKITITFDELDLKDNLVLSTINTLFKQNKAIVAPQVDIDDIIPDWANNAPKSNENTQKSKGKTKEERVTELKKYANSIWGNLSEKQKQSLKKFVEFYTEKIEKENFTINVEKQLKNWFERDKNLK